MAGLETSMPAGPPPGRRTRKKLLKAGPVGVVTMIVGVVAMIIVANFAGPAEAPPATGILAAAEAPDAGAYGGSDCAPVMFLAARGSGEAPQSNWYSLSAYNTNDGYHGLGPELWSLYSQLLQRSPGYIPYYPVMYPAAKVIPNIVTEVQYYLASVASGASAVVSDIQLLDHACHGTPHHYVLAGYSQGAWVIHDALQTLAAEGSSKLAEISGVALFGDPDFLPFKPWVRDFKWIDFARGSAAVAGQGSTEIPAQVAPRTASYCFPNDPVCQTTRINMSYLAACSVPYNLLCPHFDYVHFGEVTEAAEFLAPLLPR